MAHAEAELVQLEAQVKQMETAETAHKLTLLGQAQPVQELIAIDMLAVVVAVAAALVAAAWRGGGFDV